MGSSVSRVSKEMEDEAQKLFKNGRELLREKKWHEAETKFNCGLLKVRENGRDPEWRRGYREEVLFQMYCLFEMGEYERFMAVRPHEKNWEWWEYKIWRELMAAEVLRRQRQPAEATGICNLLLNIPMPSLKLNANAVSAIYFIRAASFYDLDLYTAATEDWKRALTQAQDPNIIQRIANVLNKNDVTTITTTSSIENNRTDIADRILTHVTTFFPVAKKALQKKDNDDIKKI